MKQTASLTIHFSDGTQKVVIVSKAIEMKVSAERKQSICFNETFDGEFVMAYTAPIMDNKSFSSLELTKNPI